MLSVLLPIKDILSTEFDRLYASFMRLELLLEVRAATVK